MESKELIFSSLTTNLHKILRSLLADAHTIRVLKGEKKQTLRFAQDDRLMPGIAGTPHSLFIA
jgi:hypothetical protein